MTANLDRFRYLLNHGGGFLPTRDQWEQIIQIGNEAIRELEVARLEGDAETERMEARCIIAPCEKPEVRG